MMSESSRCALGVKFLVDESLSSRVNQLLKDGGHNAVHVSDLGMHGAPDLVVMAAARADGPIVVTADTDFGALLAVASEPTRVS